MGRRRRGDRRSSRRARPRRGAPSHPRAMARRAECRYRGRPHRAREASRRVARPSSSRLRLLVQLLLLGRKNCLARTIFARAAKKSPPLYARCPARDATARGTPLIRAPRVPAGKPVGPGSGRWLSRVDPTAVGVVNGVVGGEAVSVPRPRVRPSSRWSAFSFWSAGGKPPSENHPPRSSPFGRPGGSKGVACLLAPKERALGDIGQAGNYSQV